MDIIVCVKQVPDTEAVIRNKPGEIVIDPEGVNFDINPHDEFGVEEAIKLKEKFGGTVTIATVGPEKATEAIRKALAMGADRAIHIVKEENTVVDQYLNAKLLFNVLKNEKFDLIFCGKQAIDDDSSQVGPMLAEFLNIPQVSFIVKLEVSEDGKKAIVHKMVEGGIEVIETTLPALFTTQKGLNVPRYPSLKGIMQAKKKEIKKIDASSLGIDLNTYKKVKIIEMFPPPKKEAGKIFNSSDEGVVAKVVSLLKEEAKVI